MKQIRGTYFNGVGSLGSDATITVKSSSVTLVTLDQDIEVPLRSLKIESRVANIPRRITWGGADSFITDDNEAVDAIPGITAGKTIVWLEQRFLVAVGSLLLVLSIGIGFTLSGIPALAKHGAFMLPENAGDEIGTVMLNNLNTLLTASEIDESRQQALREYLSKYGRVNQLHFKKTSQLGPNAFALSNTTLVLTDGLVGLADNDEEILAVYLHELGHARLRHVERSILQGSALIVLLTVITGDPNGLGELILTLPILLGQTAYSRKFEREADEFAVSKLLDAGVSPLRLASVLEKLEAFHLNRVDSDTADDEIKDPETSLRTDETVDFKNRAKKRSSRMLFEYLSTHPATKDRIRYIEKRAISPKGPWKK